MRSCAPTLALSVAALAALLPATGLGQVISELCYAAEQPAATATPPTSSTPFNCPSIGSLSISQLAAQGFRIVRLGPVSGSTAANVRQQLLVQRPVRIHGSGFEAD